MKHSLQKFPALVLAFSGLSFVSCSTAETGASGDTDYGLVASQVANLLQNQHYGRVDFEDEISKKAFDQLLDFLDYDHLYFYKPEVESFRDRYATRLDDKVLTQDLSPAHEIYSAFTAKVEARVAKVIKMLESEKFDFNGNETSQLSRKKEGWPASEKEADDLWSKRIMSEVLFERLRILQAEEKKKEKAAGQKEAPQPEAPKPETPKEEAPKPEALKDETKPGSAEAPSGTDAPKEAPAKQAVKEKKPETAEEVVIKRYKRFLESIHEADEEDVSNYLLSAISQAYDPHSEYMSLPEDTRFKTEMSKQLVGIGAVLSLRDGAAEIQQIVAGAPAHLSGELKVKDRIVGVAQGKEGEMIEVEGLKLDRIVEMIRGEEGTIVRLNVEPVDDPTTIKEIVITRAKVELKESRAKADLIELKNAPADANRLGWISIDSFYEDMDNREVSLTRDVKVLLERLKAENISGLVIDLRGNGGGSLNEAIALTGLFIKRGPVVQQKGWDGRIDPRYTKFEKPFYDGPLIVLTDKTSASASEIFAAALQDYGRAVIVGDKSTFGKGTVQTLLPMAQYMPWGSQAKRAGSLKLTIQKFYRIAGGSTQLKGVEPDLVLPSRYEALDIGEGSLPNFLPYDEIPKMKYDLADNSPLPTPELKTRLEARLKTNEEFTWVKEDIVRMKGQIDKNVVSLNEQARLTEWKENQVRDKARTDARKARVAEMIKAGDPYSVYRLTLENAKDPLLTLEKVKEAEKGAFVKGDPDEDEEGADSSEDEFLHDLEPVKLEAIHILTDLIQIDRSQRTAKVGSAQTP